ncbi:hypothetical protein [Loigolactobacillus backii]|uniref:Uncharacterized protein n=1 Tax=Loigolactobacillus backii TaxID=375175 RepID=A0A192H1A2_9LACO|nr:hypothetical protein [Loigolactobacillus backii]ANK60707.1 hypothetical protein AYR52_10875 [Loigolactobacillus backii]ANK61726.1 hypothetical protein AYR53_02455 [Loigolactobacillus backii]ANK65660.1 hypothetical protein AYR54_10675 [Loigolactobacillus backii]ANK68137.1 hypothetical protein AYR55_10830 [Loigolactobacillus backii]ANK69078.1 hypothetical protein AYR56_02265 [Loigolactobacillus backii]
MQIKVVPGDFFNWFYNIVPKQSSNESIAILEQAMEEHYLVTVWLSAAWSGKKCQGYLVDFDSQGFLIIERAGKQIQLPFKAMNYVRPVNRQWRLAY